MFRKAIAGAGAVLGLFHVWLFASQAWQGQLAEPGVLLRWLAAGGIVAALVVLRRRGASIFLGKRAVAVWLLAVLLHAPSVAGKIDTLGSPAVPEVVATLQAGLASATILGLGLLLLLGAARPRRHVLAHVDFIAIDHAPRGILSSDAVLQFAPRPPPL